MSSSGFQAANGVIPAAFERFFESPRAATLWTALVVDAGADVCLISGSGHVLWCPDWPQWWPKRGPALDHIGKHLTELQPRGLAEEMLGFVQRAIETGKAVVVRTAWQGVRTLTVYRAVSASDGGEHAAMVICRGLRPQDLDQHPVHSTSEFVESKHLDQGPLAGLTPREIHVLALIGRGLSTEGIARQMFRSRKTIEAHRQMLGKKLNARNRVELARIAVQCGLHLVEFPTLPPVNGRPVEPDDDEAVEGNG